MSKTTLLLLGLGGGLGLVLLSAVILLKVLPRLLFKKFVGGLMNAKAGPLTGARAEFGPVTSCPAPEDADQRSDEPRPPGRWLRFTARVVPQAQTSHCGFSLWDPDELSCIPTPPTGQLSLDTLDGFLETDIERANEEEDDKIAGETTVTVTVYVPDGVKSLSLHYYSALVGEPLAC